MFFSWMNFLQPTWKLLGRYQISSSSMELIEMIQLIEQESIQTTKLIMELWTCKCLQLSTLRIRYYKTFLEWKFFSVHPIIFLVLREIMVCCAKRLQFVDLWDNNHSVTKNRAFESVFTVFAIFIVFAFFCGFCLYFVFVSGSTVQREILCSEMTTDHNWAHHLTHLTLISPSQ